MTTPPSGRWRFWLAGAVTVAAIAALALYGPIPQDPAYHDLADQRRILGIPNLWNVISNLPFLVVGLIGLRRALSPEAPGILPGLRPAFVAFFVGSVLVAFGSGTYHSAPSDETLPWDRLPIAATFMAFLAIVIGEQVSVPAARRLLLPLLGFGAGSILYWWITEASGHGDLRPYVLAQYLPLILVPLILATFPSRLSPNGYYWAILPVYALAKLLEYLDAPIYRALGFVSGHTLKHLAACGAILLVLQAIRRRAVPASPHR